MSSIDSIYNKIISDIERNLPVSIKRQSGVKYRNAVPDSENSTFEKVLESAVEAESVDFVKSGLIRAVDTKDASTRIEAAIINASSQYNVDYALIKGVIKAESNFDPTCISHAGAMGLMQLMPANCEEYGVTDPYNIEQNIDAGTRHLRDMLDRYDGDVSLALAAYNAGPGNVNKYGGIPPFKETQVYVPRVLANMETYKKT